MGVWFNFARTLTGMGEPERLNGQYVSWEFFKVLGVEPLLGRVVNADDDRPNGSAGRRPQPQACGSDVSTATRTSSAA